MASGAPCPPVLTRIRLCVPYAEKDGAKALARTAGGVLDWESAEKMWYWVARPGVPMPASLARFLPGGEVDWIHVLDIPFQERERAKELGTRWDPTEKVAWIKGPIPEELRVYRPKAYSWDWWKELKKNDKTPDPHVPAEPWVAKPHQMAAAVAMALAKHSNSPGFLLADGTGLGKTMSVWSFVLDNPAMRTILIVCPASVQAHWRYTLLSAGDGGRYALVINYDKLGRLFEVESAVKVKSRKGMAKYGTAPSFDLIIWDESHKTKNPTAARSKMAAKLTAKAGFAVWLSATAGQTPLELSYLAPLLATRTGDKVSDLKDFEAWCLEKDLGVSRGAYGKWEWDGNPEACARLERWLFGPARVGGRLLPPAGMRRLPSDIEGWPEMERQFLPVELSSEETRLYHLAWQDFKGQSGKPANRAKGSAATLVEQLRFRQKGSLIRVPSTIDKVLDFLEEGRNVAVSVAFHETLDALRDGLAKAGFESAVMHGKQSDTEKEANRLRFQQEQVRVCLFTQEEGISLHQGEYGNTPRILVIHDIRWSAIQMHQIEGRCHRDGQFAPCVWSFAEDTIESQVVKVVSARVINMATMLGDPDKGLVEELAKLVNSFTNY